MKSSGEALVYAARYYATPQPFEVGSIEEYLSCNHMDTYMKLPRLLNQGKHKNDNKVNSSHLKQNILLEIILELRQNKKDSF
jgi:hypothetical protein